MLRTFVYRLYPSKAQRVRLEAVLETARRFYNDCLGERKAVYETEKRTVGKVAQLRRVKVHKANNPFAADVHSHILQVVVADLHKAYAAFFRRVREKKAKPGFPRFKGKNRFRSFGLKELDNGFKIDGRRLKITGIGRVAVRWQTKRPLPSTIKTLRVKRMAGKWYAAFACEVAAKPLPPLDNAVGIDAGLTSLFMLSNGAPGLKEPFTPLAGTKGVEVKNPRWYRKSERRLRVRQRAVSRKKLNGKNRRKAVRRLASFSAHVANQRKDYLFKLACTLVACFGRIAIEDLSIDRMVRGKYAKSILDAAWGTFRNHLLNKAENAGRQVALVAPAYTSQECSKCHHCEAGNRPSQPVFLCLHCGYSTNADVNASDNVLAAGQAAWALSSATAGLAQEAAGL